MKPLIQSRTFWIALAIVGLGTFLSAIAASPPGVFPAWVLVLCGAANVALGSVVVMLRASDNATMAGLVPAPAAPAPALTAQPAPQPPAPAPQAPIVDAPTAAALRAVLAQFDAAQTPAAPGQGPQARIGFVTALMLVLAMGLTACGSTWPTACKRDDNGVYNCSCQKYVITAKHAAGTVEQTCDDQAMPIHVRSSKITSAHEVTP